MGLDSSDDKLVKATGDLFTGTTGGSIRVVTLVASAGKHLTSWQEQDKVLTMLLLLAQQRVGNPFLFNVF
jgi:hypothetical protein